MAGAKSSTHPAKSAPAKSAPEGTALRRRLRVEIPKNGKAGCVWADGGIVTKVVSGGAAQLAGVTTCSCPKQNWLDAPCGCPDAWRIVNVQGKSLAPLCSAKFISDLLAVARSGGQYYLVFEACAPSPAEPETPRPEAECPAHEDTRTAELEARLDAVLDAKPEADFRREFVAGASEINDWLLLGTYAVAKDVLAGKRPDLRVDAILSCVCDPEDPSVPSDEETLRKANVSAYGGFWAYDQPEYDIIGDYWEHARAFLASAREKNMRVLIHCSMGVNRSAAIACAFLVEKEGFGLCEAAALLHNRRGGVLGNEGFRRQLAALAIKSDSP